MVMWQIKNVISPLLQGLSTLKLAWWESDLGCGNLTYKVTWHINHVFTWQIKNISLLSQDLWTPNLAGWWLRMREIHLQSHVTLRLCGHVTNQKYFVFTFTRHKVHKLRRMVTRVRRPHPACHVPPRSRRHVTTI